MGKIIYRNLLNRSCMLLHTQHSSIIFMHTKVWKQLSNIKKEQSKVLIVEFWIPENTCKISCREGKAKFIVHHGKENPAFSVLVASWTGEEQGQNGNIYKVWGSDLRKVFQ